MGAEMMDGRVIAQQMQTELSQAVAQFVAAQSWAPGLAVLQAGSDPASDWYVRQIRRCCERLGLAFALHSLDAQADTQQVLAVLRQLNTVARTNGIIVQMPLPPRISQEQVVAALDPAKDVDGVHPLNAGRLMQGSGETFVPATPAGGMELLRRYGVSLAGKHAVMVGRSNIVGRPMALLMLHQHATVTICHSRTPDLAAITRQAEVLAVAVGKPRLITAEMVRPGAVVVDFGANVVDGQLVGDVDTEGVATVASLITPVPGGTGPMTNILLAQNTLAAAQRQIRVQ